MLIYKMACDWLKMGKNSGNELGRIMKSFTRFYQQCLEFVQAHRIKSKGNLSREYLKKYFSPS